MKRANIMTSAGKRVFADADHAKCKRYLHMGSHHVLAEEMEAADSTQTAAYDGGEQFGRAHRPG